MSGEGPGRRGSTQVTIVGAGAIGGLAGAYMAQAGTDVLLVDHWAEHVDALNRKGLSVDGIRGKLHFQVRAKTPDALTEPLDVVLLATKSQDTVAAVQAILPLVGPATTIVSMQNGFNEAKIAAALDAAGLPGRSMVVGAIPNYGGALVDPGHIEFVHEGPIQIGELDGSNTPRLDHLAELLSTLTSVERTGNIEGQIWAKEIYFAQIVFSALADAPYGETLGVERFALAAAAPVREGLAVADVSGVRVERFAFFDPDAYRAPGAEGDRRVLEAINHAVWLLEKDQKARAQTLRKKSSGVWWDIVYRRRPSEVRWASGELVDIGRQLGVDVGLLEKLCSMIYEIEDGRRSLGLHNCEEFAAFVDARQGRTA